MKTCASAIAFAWVALAGFASSPSYAAGTPYTIEFNCFGASPPCQTVASYTLTVGDSEFAYRPWGSAYKPGKINGSDLPNGSSHVIGAVHIQVVEGDDTFVADLGTVGNVFTDVYQSTDSKQLLYTGANVAPDDDFWMRVKPGTPANPYSHFSGRLFAPEEQLPDHTGWNHIFHKSRPATNTAWERLLAACPSKYHHIDAYTDEGPDRRILFVSHGVVLIYDDDKRAISYVHVDRPVPVGINRITLEHGPQGDEFVFWENGSAGARASKQALKTGRSIRSVQK